MDKNSITELAKRLEPYLLKAGYASASNLMTNRIILYPDDGGDISLYPKTAAGFDAALAAASTNDLITVPPCNITGAHTIPNGVKVTGLGNTSLKGTITLAGAGGLENIWLDVSGSSSDPVIGVVGSGGTAYLKRVFMDVQNTGAGPAYCVSQTAGGLVEVFDCNAEAVGGEGSTEYYADGGTITAYGGAALSETPARGSTIEVFSVGEEISTGDIPVTSGDGATISGLTVGELYAVESWNGYWRGKNTYPIINSNFELNDGTGWSGNVGQSFDAQYNPSPRTTLPSFAVACETFTSGVDGKVYGRVYFFAPATSILIRLSSSYYPDNSGTLSWRLSHASAPAFGDVRTYGVAMPNVATGANRGVPMEGDRSAWDAGNFPQRHTNDSDTPNGIHHTLGTGPNQAAAGDHSHEFAVFNSGSALKGSVLTADGAGGINWEAVNVIAAGALSNPPTLAELEAILGTPAFAGDGKTYIVQDTGTDKRYLVVSTGASYLYMPLLVPLAGTGAALPTILETGQAGGWVWHSRPKAMHYNGKTFITFVGTDRRVSLVSFDHATSTFSTRTTLRQFGELDDHNTPSLLLRDSDKRLLLFFAGHNSSGLYMHTSTNAEDVSAWGAEANLDSQLGGNEYSYTEPVQLTGETNDPIYLFYRNRISDYASSWRFSKSVNGGANWAAQTVFYQNTGAMSYLQVARNGDSRMDFLVTDGHEAHQAAVSVYHFYYQGGSYYKTDGTLITASLPLDATHLTQIYDGTPGSAKIWDIQIDGTGKPVVVFAVFPGNDWTDHRYYYGRWTGSAWDVHEICAAGHGIETPYTSSTYSGGIALDPSDVNTVYYSREEDDKFELYKAVTANGGTSWTETPITVNSSNKNIRPAVPVDHAAGLDVVWLNGTYTTYTNFNTVLLGATED